MIESIASLLDTPLLLLAMLCGGILIGMALERFRRAMQRRTWRNSNGPRDGDRTFQPAALKRQDAADQLRIVMKSDFTIQPLLNKSEARVFRELDQLVISSNPGWQVMAQVSLGEILRSADREAYGCINSKRVDLLLVDENCMPRHAVEYQGVAHHQGTAAARDAVKKEALRRAGISYHEVIAGQTTPAELRRLVEKLVSRLAKPGAAVPPTRASAWGRAQANVSPGARGAGADRTEAAMADAPSLATEACQTTR